MNEEKIDMLIAELDRILPPVFARSKIEQYLGGLISPKYLAALDSEGKGPENAIRCGRHICYIKAPFLCWLRKRMTTPEKRCGIVIPREKAPADTLLDSLHEFSTKA